MSARPTDGELSPQDAARRVFNAATDRASLGVAVVRFHRQVDAMLAESHRAHRTEVACRRGCSLCCHMQVEMLPPEAFALADWLRRHLAPAALDRVVGRLRDNARRTHELGGVEARRTANLPCALLGEDGACTAYEARPAQCRRFHSQHLATCEQSFAQPGDDAILSPAHPLVAHNAQVIVTLAQHGLREAGRDAQPQDMNLALLPALEDARAWRRWKDGKKSFAMMVRAFAIALPATLAFALALDED